MTALAPYTRDTLDRIRKGANASHLGWPEDRYRTICRHHGIEPMASAARAEPEPPPPVRPEKPLKAPDAAKARTRVPHGTPKFKHYKAQLVGDDVLDEYINCRMTKRARVNLVDQAGELDLTLMGMLTLLIETAARQGTCGIIIGIEPEEKTRAEDS